jgi:hypothetical protein
MSNILIINWLQELKTSGQSINQSIKQASKQASKQAISKTNVFKKLFIRP